MRPSSGRSSTRKAGAEYEEAESLRLYAGSGLYGPAPVDDVIRRCEEIMAVAKGNPTAEAGAIRSLGALKAMQGQIDEGRRLIRRSMEVMEENGLKMRATFTSEAAGFIETLAGNHADAERLLRAAHDEVARIGDLGYQATAAALVAQAICAQGGSMRRRPSSYRSGDRSRGRSRDPGHPAERRGEDPRVTRRRCSPPTSRGRRWSWPIGPMT